MHRTRLKGQECAFNVQVNTALRTDQADRGPPRPSSAPRARGGPEHAQRRRVTTHQAPGAPGLFRPRLLQKWVLAALLTFFLSGVPRSGVHWIWVRF